MALKAYALTTVQRAADFIGLGTLTQGTTKYTVIELLINAMTEYIENYVGFRVKQNDVTSQELDGDGSDTLFISGVNLSNIATLQYRTTGDSSSGWETIDSDQYHIYEDEGYIRFIGSRKFMAGKRNYRVSYRSGYDFDNATTFLADTEAGDLELAIWKLVAAGWERRKGGGGIKSESIGDYSVSYTEGGSFADPDVIAILDNYRSFSGPITYATPEHY